jgi:hypothetical protein
VITGCSDVYCVWRSQMTESRHHDCSASIIVVGHDHQRHEVTVWAQCSARHVATKKAEVYTDWNIRIFAGPARTPFGLSLSRPDYLKALLNTLIYLAFEARHKDIGQEVCTVIFRTSSGRGQLRKSPRKSRRWDLLRSPTRNPEMLYISFDCYHANQVLDPNTICAAPPGPVHTSTLT